MASWLALVQRRKLDYPPIILVQIRRRWRGLGYQHALLSLQLVPIFFPPFFPPSAELAPASSTCSPFPVHPPVVSGNLTTRASERDNPKKASAFCSPRDPPNTNRQPLFDPRLVAILCRSWTFDGNVGACVATELGRPSSLGAVAAAAPCPLSPIVFVVMSHCDVCRSPQEGQEMSNEK